MAEITATLDRELIFRSYTVTSSNGKKFTVTVNNKNPLNELQVAVFWFANGKRAKTIPEDVATWAKYIIKSRT